jgi:hypothetical protein
MKICDYKGLLASIFEVHQLIYSTKLISLTLLSLVSSAFAVSIPEAADTASVFDSLM